MSLKGQLSTVLKSIALTQRPYTQLKKPYVALSGTTGITFDIAPNTTYEFKCDVEQSTAKGVFTFLIKNGTATTVDTQYGGFNAGETSELKTFTACRSR